MQKETKPQQRYVSRIFSRYSTIYSIRHKTTPPIFFSTHCLASNMPRSVAKKRHSPGDRNPSTVPLLDPRMTLRKAGRSIMIRLVGLLTGVILPSTGSLCQYFRPSQSRLDATLACVTGSVSITPLAAAVAASVADVAVGWPRRR